MILKMVKKKKKIKLDKIIPLGSKWNSKRVDLQKLHEKKSTPTLFKEEIIVSFNILPTKIN